MVTTLSLCPILVNFLALNILFSFITYSSRRTDTGLISEIHFKYMSIFIQPCFNEEADDDFLSRKVIRNGATATINIAIENLKLSSFTIPSTRSPNKQSSDNCSGIVFCKLPLEVKPRLMHQFCIF